MRFHAYTREEAARQIDAVKANMVRVNDDLYANVAPKGDDWRVAVDNWHDRALYWMELTGKVVEDPSKLDLWKKVGTDLSHDASDIASDANASWLSDFALRMPAAIASVLVWTGTTVGETVGAAAEGVGLGASKVLVVGGLVLAAYLLVPKLLLGGKR